MKNTLLLSFLLSCTLCLSQDAELFENNWYLYELVINEENFIPPSNDELENIVLYFIEGNDRFETIVCSYLAGDPVEYNQ